MHCTPLSPLPNIFVLLAFFESPTIAILPTTLFSPRITKSRSTRINRGDTPILSSNGYILPKKNFRAKIFFLRSVVDRGGARYSVSILSTGLKVRREPCFYRRPSARKKIEKIFFPTAAQSVSSCLNSSGHSSLGSKRRCSRQCKSTNLGLRWRSHRKTILPAWVEVFFGWKLIKCKTARTARRRRIVVGYGVLCASGARVDRCAAQTVRCVRRQKPHARLSLAFFKLGGAPCKTVVRNGTTGLQRLRQRWFFFRKKIILQVFLAYVVNVHWGTCSFVLLARHF